MRRLTIILGLVVGLIAPLVLTTGSAARPFDPAPRPPVAAVDQDSCPSGSTSAAAVPGGVYRAMVEELRQQGYSRAQIRAELGKVLIVPASGTRSTGADRCSTNP